MPRKLDLEELFGDVKEAEPTGKIIPNVFPTITNVPYRIAIVGEAPGKDEEAEGVPFVGYSGKDLNRHLSRFGILRDACFIGNICQYRPPYNQIARFEWQGKEIQHGISRLREDLNRFNPNVVLCLGGSALHIFKAPHYTPKKRRKGKDVVFHFPNSISDWRGSFFEADGASPAPLKKCIASYHPAACLRNYEWTPYLLMDISRCAKEARTTELVFPQRTLAANLTFEETVQHLERVLVEQTPVGTDIEGYWDNWKCISFSPRPDFAFIVPWVDMSGRSYWNVDQEVVLQTLVSRILAHPKIVKVWQNGLYDRFVLQYGYGVCTCGPSHDIMLKHWELYCELEKALSVQCSIYTSEPYYKAEIDSDDAITYWKYCCRDSAVTKEIDEQLDRYLKPPSRRHYNFNLILLNALLYMELRGIKYDKTKATQRLKEIESYLYERQVDLDKLAGTGLRTTDRTLLRTLLRDKMCYKKDPSRVKADFVDCFDLDMRILCGDAELSKSEIGRLSTDLGCSLNVKGAQLKDFLYKTLGLPEQHDPDTGAITSDYEALITLRKKSNHPALPIIIEMTELRTRAQMLHMKTDPDGRIRSSYNEVGSDTGRVTSNTSPTGSGYNLQTIPDENELKPDGHPLQCGMRDLVVSDEGHLLGKCDLKGADGWTVGANLASLGDDTMLDDLRFGLKPASVLCYGSRHGYDSITGKSRAELNELCREVKKSDWDYFAYKQCIWGFCYLMGARKASQHVFNVSEGTVTVTEDMMEMARQMLIRRYSLPLWWKAMEKRLFSQPYPPQLESPSGHIRKFWGRHADILGQALAHEPQSVTTYATNKAVYRCWTVSENRYKTLDGKTRLRVEPLHQVHDEFLCQFKKEDVAWATTAIKSWFNNEITIAGIKLVIPYEGSYGTNWAMDKESKCGSF